MMCVSWSVVCSLFIICARVHCFPKEQREMRMVAGQETWCHRERRDSEAEEDREEHRRYDRQKWRGLSRKGGGEAGWVQEEKRCKREQKGDELL